MPYKFSRIILLAVIASLAAIRAGYLPCHDEVLEFADRIDNRAGLGM